MAQAGPDNGSGLCIYNMPLAIHRHCSLNPIPYLGHTNIVRRILYHRWNLSHSQTLSAESYPLNASTHIQIIHRFAHIPAKMSQKLPRGRFRILKTAWLNSYMMRRRRKELGHAYSHLDLVMCPVCCLYRKGYLHR